MTSVGPGSIPIALLGVCLGLGLFGMGWAVVGRGPATRRSEMDGEEAAGARWPTDTARTGVHVGSLAISVGVGLACAVATGWPVAGPIAGVATYGLPRLLRQMSAEASIATLDASASWTEMLQGTLAASAGLGQAIVATAELSPAPIREATERLARESIAYLRKCEPRVQ